MESISLLKYNTHSLLDSSTAVHHLASVTPGKKCCISSAYFDKSVVLYCLTWNNTVMVIHTGILIIYSIQMQRSYQQH